MKPVELLPAGHQERLNLAVDHAWRIFKSRFIHKRHSILKEAPFQHHFAQILSEVGSLYCLDRSDVFFVDLEAKCEGVKGRSKFIDVTCSFANAAVSCAIELKFKTERQGAQDWGRIDAYCDIEAVETVCQTRFSFGRFFMITDSSVYVNESKRGVGTVFRTHDGHRHEPSGALSCPNSKGRENVVVTLAAPYDFSWEQGDGWYFLEVKVPGTPEPNA